MIGNGQPEIAAQLLENIHQRWRRLDAGATEKQSPCACPGTVIRVLAEDHHFYIIEVGKVKRIEDLPAGRIDGLAQHFFLSAEK